MQDAEPLVSGANDLPGPGIGFAELPDTEGAYLGHSDWMTIDQARIDLFADATDDHQWIHVDPGRAAAAGMNGTIAHGYLTLAVTGARLADLLRVEGAARIINYGVDWVRFPAPLPCGRRIRTSGSITSVTEVDCGYQVSARLVTEVEGSERPVCVADVVVRYLGEDNS